MRKTGLVKEDKSYYTATKNCQFINFKRCSYITISGKGEPAGKEFTDKVSRLYPVAFGVKKITRKYEEDFTVPKLEGLWWADGYKEFLSAPTDQWHWKFMIRMPAFVTKEIVQMALKEAEKQKGIYIAGIQFEQLNEGKSVQILHTGPYATEHHTILQVYDFMKKNSLSFNGRHHEIYLSDPNKTAAEKMKTILRQPVK